LDRERRQAIGRHADITLTGLYNAIAKANCGEALTSKERLVYELGGGATIEAMQADLDREVAAAYGWSWPLPSALVLERLVTLHDERVLDEHYGTVHWLRESFQAPKGDERPGARNAPQQDLPVVAATDQLRAWPTDAIGQITEIRHVLLSGVRTFEALRAAFASAHKELLLRHVETLVLLGEVEHFVDGTYQLARGGALSAV
jgi:hypothetical protein